MNGCLAIVSSKLVNPRDDLSGRIRDKGLLSV